MIDAIDYPNREIGERRLPPTDMQDRAIVAVNLAEGPLGWLIRRDMLSDRQIAAAARLQDDHARSGLAVRVTMSWEAAPRGRHTGAGADMQITGALDAKRRFDRAMAAVGNGLSDILWRVVCEGEGITEAERGLGWPARAAKLVLGMALDRLADHYENQIGLFYT